MSQTEFPQPKNENLETRFVRKIQPSKWVAIIVAGLVVGLLTVTLEISFAVLVFSGDLTVYVSRGIGLFLAGTLIATIVTGLTSSYPGTVSINQDVPAAIAAVIAAGIAGSMSASATSDEVFLTIVAAIIISSLLTGLAFVSQGYLKLGALIRFLPYPVVGGFLAGTGWLLASGGLAVMTGIPPVPGQLPALFQPDLLLRWLPGVIFAIVLLLIVNRFHHYLILPGMILGAVGLFYLVLLLLNVPVQQISDQGWLLGPFPDEGLWQPFTPFSLSMVNWSAIGEQAGNIAAILVVSTIALLLNASGIELTVKQDLQFNRELQVNGFGTFGSGLVGGLVSYSALSLSILGYRMGSGSRLLSLGVAIVLAFVLFLGTTVLSWLPKMIFGSLLVFLGLTLLDDWLYKAWSRFSRIDFFIITSILVVIAFVGFLQGVVLGLVLAVTLFVINYSRINVVKHSLSGANFQSRVTRSHVHQNVLTEKGEGIYILQLQGFIFFGTAHNLLNQVRQRVEATNLPPIRFVVLDFRQVTGLDSTAIFSFTKMKHIAQNHQFVLVFANPALESALPGQDISVANFFAEMDADEQGQAVRTVNIFPDLDRGLEWCENQILQEAGVDLHDDQEDLRTQLRSLLPDVDHLDDLIKYFERLEVETGYYLMKQGDLPDDLFFIESGQVTALLEFPDRPPIRLETMRGGRVVGEIGFYLNRPRTAAVVTDEPSTIYRLSAQTMHRMEQNDPEAASLFHQGIIRLVAERLTHLIDTINALQR